MGYEKKVIDSAVEGDSLKQKVEIYADSETDIPEAMENWVAGSYVFIIDTQDVKFLNTEGVWV